MTVNEAIRIYSEKFGGFPHFLFMGASEEDIIQAVEHSLETGEEIEVVYDDADY